MQDSNIATNGGPGAVDSKKFKRIVEKWGTLPERERRAYVQELTTGLSDKHRQAIYNYFKRLSESQRKRVAARP
jgi:ribosomal protein S21